MHINMIHTYTYLVNCSCLSVADCFLIFSNTVGPFIFSLERGATIVERTAIVLVWDFLFTPVVFSPVVLLLWCFEVLLVVVGAVRDLPKVTVLLLPGTNIESFCWVRGCLREVFWYLWPFGSTGWASILDNISKLDSASATPVGRSTDPKAACISADELPLTGSKSLCSVRII